MPRSILTNPSKPHELVVVFLKAPMEGLVKTRLARKTGNRNALKIYRHFVSDTLLSVKQESRYTLCFYPEDKKSHVTGWLGNNHSYLPQRGLDLGERMKNAFIEAFSQGNERVIVIGTDIPDLPADTISKALLSLRTKDAVVGPCPDGGYYLIGFQKKAFTVEVFKDMEWSTETVLQKTVETLEKNSLDYHLLPRWNDIDTWEDFTDFIERNIDRTEFIEKYRVFSEMSATEANPL